jgi:hypothetical protein
MGGKAFKRAANLEPIWFTLGESQVRFDCEDDIPGGMILDFSGNVEGKDGAQDQLAAVKDFFNAAIIESQQSRFWEMLYDKKEKVGVSMLIELAQWLAGEYSDRPTGQSSEDTPPRISTGVASTAGASAAASTYSRPEPVGATA